MSTTGWQPPPQLQGLSFDCTPGLGGWRLQVPVGGFGSAGSSSDAQIFKNSELKHKTEDRSIGLTESESLVDDGPKVNYFILRDVAIPLKPYSRRGIDLNQRVFNYRLSRGRRVVENAFGILTSRFPIFRRPMQQEPSVVVRVVMACLVLHNLLRI